MPKVLLLWLVLFGQVACVSWPSPRLPDAGRHELGGGATMMTTTLTSSEAGGSNSANGIGGVFTYGYRLAAPVGLEFRIRSLNRGLGHHCVAPEF